MGSVIAAATNAPMTGIFMVWEMTDNSAIMLPLMLSVVVSHAVARRLEPDSLYSGWLGAGASTSSTARIGMCWPACASDDAFDRQSRGHRQHEP